MPTPYDLSVKDPKERLVCKEGDRPRLWMLDLKKESRLSIQPVYKKVRRDMLPKECHSDGGTLIEVEHEIDEATKVKGWLPTSGLAYHFAEAIVRLEWQDMRTTPELQKAETDKQAYPTRSLRKRKPARPL